MYDLFVCATDCKNVSVYYHTGKKNTQSHNVCSYQWEFTYKWFVFVIQKHQIVGEIN